MATGSSAGCWGPPPVWGTVRLIGTFSSISPTSWLKASFRTPSSSRSMERVKRERLCTAGPDQATDAVGMSVVFVEREVEREVPARSSNPAAADFTFGVSCAVGVSVTL